MRAHRGRERSSLFLSLSLGTDATFAHAASLDAYPNGSRSLRNHACRDRSPVPLNHLSMILQLFTREPRGIETSSGESLSSDSRLVIPRLRFRARDGVWVYSVESSSFCNRADDRGKVRRTQGGGKCLENRKVCFRFSFHPRKNPPLLRISVGHFYGRPSTLIGSSGGAFQTCARRFRVNDSAKSPVSSTACYKTVSLADRRDREGSFLRIPRAFASDSSAVSRIGFYRGDTALKIATASPGRVSDASYILPFTALEKGLLKDDACKIRTGYLANGR